MEKISLNRKIKIIIRNVLTAIVICGLGSALFSWLGLGILDIGFIITWSIGLLFFSFMFWGILEMLRYILKEDGIIKKEIKIPYPWNILVILAGGTILTLILVFLAIIGFFD